MSFILPHHSGCEIPPLRTPIKGLTAAARLRGAAAARRSADPMRKRGDFSADLRERLTALYILYIYICIWMYNIYIYIYVCEDHHLETHSDPVSDLDRLLLTIVVVTLLG